MRTFCAAHTVGMRLIASNVTSVHVAQPWKDMRHWGKGEVNFRCHAVRQLEVIWKHWFKNTLLPQSDWATAAEPGIIVGLIKPSQVKEE